MCPPRSRYSNDSTTAMAQLLVEMAPQIMRDIEESQRQAELEAECQRLEFKVARADTAKLRDELTSPR